MEPNKKELQPEEVSVMAPIPPRVESKIKKIFIFLIISLFVIIIGFFIYQKYIKNNEQVLLDKTLNNKIEDSDNLLWKTYYGEENYSIDLPDSFTANNGYTASGLKYYSSTDPKLKDLNIAVEVANNSTNDDFNQYYSSLLQDSRSTSNTKENNTFTVRGKNNYTKSFIKDGWMYNLMIDWDESSETVFKESLVSKIGESFKYSLINNKQEKNMENNQVNEEDKKAILASLSKIHAIIDGGKMEEFKAYVNETETSGKKEELPDEVLVPIRDLYKEDILKIESILKSPDKMKWSSEGEIVSLTFVAVDESKNIVLEIPPLDLPFPEVKNVENEPQKFYGGTYNRTVEFIQKNNEWYMRSSIF